MVVVRAVPHVDCVCLYTASNHNRPRAAECETAEGRLWTMLWTTNSKSVRVVDIGLRPFGFHVFVLMMVEMMLPGVQSEASPGTRWFRPFGCVVQRDGGVCEVFVGGVLVGTYRGAGERNVLLVNLSEEPRTRDRELGEAFGVSGEIVGAGHGAPTKRAGIVAVATVGKAGAPTKVTPRLIQRVWVSFERGYSIAATARVVRKDVSYGTVWGLRAKWEARAEVVTGGEAAGLAVPVDADELGVGDARKRRECGDWQWMHAGDDGAGRGEHGRGAGRAGSVLGQAAPSGTSRACEGRGRTVGAGCDTGRQEAQPWSMPSKRWNSTRDQKWMGPPAWQRSDRHGLGAGSGAQRCRAACPRTSRRRWSKPSMRRRARAYSRSRLRHRPWKRTLVDAIETPGLNEGPEVDKAACVAAFEQGHGEMSVEEAMMGGERDVQHAGAWIVLAMLNAMGIYRHAAWCNAGVVGWVALRIALDAVAMALVIGQGCVEGVRRLATSSAPTLLRACSAASASWTRDVLHRFANVAGISFHLAIARDLIREAVDDTGRVVLYVDNHMRHYTGKHTVRKGWKMQDRRVVPGSTDYYVHNIDGQPLMRVDVTSHDSLTKWLCPIGELRRHLLGNATPVLLSFDRGGAFAEQMADFAGATLNSLPTSARHTRCLRRPHSTISVRSWSIQREPVWGWRDDRLEIMERQIDLAADNGIAFFAFCWYWATDPAGDRQ